MFLPNDSVTVTRQQVLLGWSSKNGQVEGKTYNSLFLFDHLTAGSVSTLVGRQT
jgi:hypothetical protein